MGFLPLSHSEKRRPKCLRDHEKPFDTDLMMIPLSLELHGNQAVPPTQVRLLCPQLGWLGTAASLHWWSWGANKTLCEQKISCT